MKYSEIFKKRINCSNKAEVFDYLTSTLKDTITRWNYFVDWQKAYKIVSEFEIDLNTMNYLVGKSNIENEFKVLLNKNPSLARVIPVVIACRENVFKILDTYDYSTFKYKEFLFEGKSSLTAAEISKVVEFARDTGFLKILKEDKIKNLVDYVFGIEVGIDSNGRKNRGGRQMEDVVEYFVRDICEKASFSYIRQATAKIVKKEWNITMTTDRSARSVDFAINNGAKIYLIETNFYGGGGSKLKSTAGEYRTMFDHWKKDGHGFIWITDGRGWRTTSRPLQETFDYTDYILNLKMVSQNLLADIITNNL